MEQNIIAVSQVNEYIKFLLDRDELLGNICVRGELSNYKVCLLYTSDAADD